MRPIFTIHAGEYLVASHVESTYKDLDVWIPSRDTGVDLLLTDKSRRKTAGIQVKFSKDFLVTHKGPAFQKALRAWGWWTFDPKKIKRSPADFWVLVLLGFDRRTTDYIVIEPKDLLRRLRALHRQPRIQTYLWVTNDRRGKPDRCWEPRGLEAADQAAIAAGTFDAPPRDFTDCLNERGWSRVLKRVRPR